MAFVTGLFINNPKELEWEEKIVTRSETSVPEHPSCNHVSMEQCKSGNPKFCPECGIRLRVLSEEVVPEISKTIYKNNISEEPNIRIFQPESYVEEGYICGHYGGDCKNCLEEYYTNPLKGYKLKEGYTLVYTDYSFCILYEVELKENIMGVTISSDLIAFRHNVLDFCSRHNINGYFEVRYIHF